MRILQVNTYMPIRQNKMAFRGRDAKPTEAVPAAPLLQQLAEFEEKIKAGMSWEDAESGYRKLYLAAEERLTNGTAIPDDAKVLTNSAEAIVRIILSEIDGKTAAERREAILNKANIIHKAVEGIIPVAYENSNGSIRIRNRLHLLFAPYR